MDMGDEAVHLCKFVGVGCFGRARPCMAVACPGGVKMVMEKWYSIRPFDQKRGAGVGGCPYRLLEGSCNARRRNRCKSTHWREVGECDFPLLFKVRQRGWRPIYRKARGELSAA